MMSVRRYMRGPLPGSAPFKEDLLYSVSRWAQYEEFFIFRALAEHSQRISNATAGRRTETVGMARSSGFPYTEV